MTADCAQNYLGEKCYGIYKRDKSRRIKLASSVATQVLRDTEVKLVRMVKIDTDCNPLTSCERVGTMPEAQAMT